MDWISVNDRLPEVEVHVFVYDHEECLPKIASRNVDNTWSELDDQYIFHNKVTHWMPLPEPPEDI